MALSALGRKTGKALEQIFRESNRVEERHIGLDGLRPRLRDLLEVRYEMHKQKQKK